MTIPNLSPKALARTYSSPTHADPWEAVEDYQEYLEVSARNPQSGSSALSSKMEMPRGRIRSWMNGSKPDPARAVAVAEERDWFTDDPHSQTFRGLNRLVAWIFSGGSINDLFVPQFAVDDPTSMARVTDALDAVGIDHRLQRENEQGRATEVVPTDHGSVLGRALVVMGAPQGQKAEQSNLSLPIYLDDAPERVRREFVDVYLRNRASRQDDRLAIRFREQRSERYLMGLASLIEGVADAPVTVSEKNVYLSSEASEGLYGKLNRPF